MKLNVGCGRRKKRGYVGIDLVKSSAVDKVAPAWDLPYEDNVIEEVFSSHMIEHLSPAEFQKALKEWKRVLKEGGKLVLRCPNFLLYVRMWMNGNYSYRWGEGIRNVYGWQDRGPGMLTRNGFTRKRLGKLVEKAGFKDVQCNIAPTRSGDRTNGDLICVATR